MSKYRLHYVTTAQDIPAVGGGGGGVSTSIALAH